MTEHTPPTAPSVIHLATKVIRDATGLNLRAAFGAANALRSAHLLPDENGISHTEPAALPETPSAAQVFSPPTEPITLTPEQRATIDLMNAHPEVTGAQWLALGGLAVESEPSTDALIELIAKRDGDWPEIGRTEHGAVVRRKFQAALTYWEPTLHAALSAALAASQPKEA